MKKKIYGLIFLILFFFQINDSCAYTFENISIHGFGGWAYGKTDNDNAYLCGEHDGNYDYLDFSLNINAKPHEKLSIFVQPAFNEDRNENEVTLDYAFAEWAFSDALRLRMGKVKAPFMLYTEVYDVGTIRPFFFLPQSMYQRLAAEAYKGVGITGSLLKWDWEFLYDLYGGKLELLSNHYLSIQEFKFESITPVVNDMFGGRVLIYPPYDGLGFGVSWYTGDITMEGKVDNPAIDTVPGNYIFLGISAEYRYDPVWIRCEYLTQPKSSNVKLDVGYAELAYKFTEHWQTAIRYEFADISMENLEVQTFPENLIEHEEFVMGLNYWFNPNLVLKLSYHIAEGNHFAHPKTPEEYLTGMISGYDEKTRMVVLGVQFSF